MTLDELDRRFRAAHPPPRRAGSVTAIVLRRGDAQHELPDRARLEPGRGVIGDRWERGTSPERVQEVTMIERRVAEVLRPDGPPDLSGDNLVVDFELSTDALPTGTRLRVGTAILEITDRSYRGCAKFSARFGPEALRWVNLDEGLALRRRGVKLQIVTAGDVAIGDRIERT